MKTHNYLVMGVGMVAVALACGAAHHNGQRLSKNDMLQIRGSGPGGGVQSAPLNDCINGDKYTYGNNPPVESTCVKCQTGSKTSTWLLTAGIQSVVNKYPNIANQCPDEGTEYLNQTYKICKTPDPPNNLTCNSGDLDCHWRCYCDDGGIV